MDAIGDYQENNLLFWPAKAAYGRPGDYPRGAKFAGFTKVANAMPARGIVEGRPANDVTNKHSLARLRRQAVRSAPVRRCIFTTRSAALYPCPHGISLSATIDTFSFMVSNGMDAVWPISAWERSYARLMRSYDIEEPLE